MARPRIAFFSPFNPVRSGVSDYSEELLPYLSRHADIELVTDGYDLSNAPLRTQFPTCGVAEFLKRKDPCDLPVYQLANSVAHHGYMIEAMQRFPGLAVLHDFYLHFLMLGLTLERGRMKPLREILAAVYGRGAGPYARRLWLSVQDPYQVALIRPLVEMSRAIVTHSEYARSLVLRDSPETPVHVIPMGMPPADLSCRDSVRVAHGIQPGDFVLASVSTLSHTKRIDVLLDGAILAARRYPQLRIFILGGGRLSDRARRAIRASGFEDRIWLAGWTPASTYNELLVAVDAVADLRYPSGAETSASVLRAIAAGRPAIVSAQGSFLELPDDFTLKIEVGGSEPARVERAIAQLIDDPQRRAVMSEAAQSWAGTRLSLENAATRYMEAALDAMSRAPRRAWDLAPAESKASRRFWSGTYKMSRVGYMYRNYGLGPTLRRLKSEAGLSRAT